MTEGQRDRLSYNIERNLEDVTLIWCDQNIDDSSNSQYMQILLRQSNNYVQFYTDPQLCIDFIQSIKDEKILLVISHVFEKKIIPEVYSLSTVNSIFMLCADREHYTSLSKPDQYKKTVQIFSDKQALIKSVRSRIHLIRKQTMEFTVFDSKRQKSARDISKEFASFLWYQLLINILRQIPSTDQALHDMLEKCSEYYRSNSRMLELIEQFRTTYTRDKAVEWYTTNSFVYRLINKALRTEDTELLYLFRTYIVDLCWQLEQEHKKLLTTDILTLYRGQEMPVDEFERLKQGIGILVSPNGFFSTSKDLIVALNFIADGRDTDENRFVLFEITADPRLESVIFADIHTLSKMPEENEFLFSLGAVFIVKEVKYDSSINVWRVYMTAVDEGSKQKAEHLKLIQHQMDEGYKPIILFGDLLWRNLGEYDKAQKYFETLLESLPYDHEDIPYVYHQLANVFNQKDEWNMALDSFKKSYDLYCRHLPSDHLQLARSLNAIGLMYGYKQDYDQALDYYNQAFAIYRKTCSDDHLSIAHVLMNTGIVLREKKEYDDALDYFTKALEIYKRLLPEQDHMIARCLDNFGRLYEEQLNFNRALDFYHQQYEMNEKVFPSEHIYLADDLNKIVNTYKKNGKYEKAINFAWMKFLQQKQDLPKMHIRNAHTLQTLGDLYSEKDILHALDYYHEALAVFENCTPQDQPATVRCLERISDLYYNLSTYDEALNYRQKALNIQQKFRSPKHLNIAHTLEWLGKIYFNIKKYTQALDRLRRAIQIYEADYGSEHEKFKETQQCIDEIEATLQNDH